MLKLKAVSKSFGAHRVLHGVELELARSGTTVLIGPSGCGKSTVLRLCIGLLAADSGQVVFDGVDLTPANVLSLRRRMGYVIQEGGLFPHLSAADNTALMARYLGWGKPEIAKRIDELRDLVRLPAECMQRFPGELSGGQRQRVSLMRALMLDPEVLLLDEPLAALDPMIRAELQRDLRDIFTQLQKTVCWVTHDLAEAAYFSDRIVLLRAGQVVQTGSLAELREQPADEFVQQFVHAQSQLAGQA